MKHPIRHQRSVYLTIAAGFGVGALCTAAVLSGNSLPTAFAQARPSSPKVEVSAQPAPRPSLAKVGSTESTAELKNLNESFANLAEYAGAAVVDIKAVQESRPNANGMRTPLAEGTGSGFIFRPDGYVLTNDHVVGSASKVTVTLKDGREYEGRVTRAPEMDIAIVKIEAKDLPTLSFADSRNVRPGQFAMALGAPFGLENTVTIGHISALHRAERVIEDKVYADLIQTDTAINRGNSGGPLVNIDGQVIGINTAIFSPSGTSAGIGFAIPSNQAQFIADILLEKGKITRSYLGIQMESLKEYERKKFNVGGGARVTALPNDGPAYLGGIRKDDVITKVGDRTIESSVDLRNAMVVIAPGTSVKVEYLRDGQRKSTDVKLATPPPMPQRPRMERFRPNELPFDFDPEMFQRPDRDDKSPFDAPPSDGKPRLGVSVVDPSEEMRKQFEIPTGTKGAVVAAVTPGSIASTLGMKTGDLIVKFGDQTISSAEQLVKAVEKVRKGETVSVKYLRYLGGTSTVEASVTF
ncbi:MAG: trypsin-like peptidase domain-containing protein [Fimbriimonadaceae bacterium]|nr:trypsin-like peptidase domain-containing protein [Fimbriimonadaceae bacterium]